MVKGLDDFNRQRSKMKILSLQKIFGVMQPIFIVKEDFGIQKKNSIEKVRYMESLLYQVYKSLSSQGEQPKFDILRL